MYFRWHGQNYWVRRQFGSSMGGHANTIALRTGLHRGFYLVYIHPISLTSLDLLADWLRHESLDFDEMHKQGDVWTVLYVALHVIDGQMVRRQMGLDVVLLHFALCTCRSIAFCFMSRRRWEVEGLHDTPERPSDRASAAKRAARSPQFLSHRHSACTGEILVYSFGLFPKPRPRLESLIPTSL